MNFLHHQQFKSHCEKCGRRTRNYNTYKYNYQLKNEQNLCYQRQQCLFPTELPSYSIVTQTNDNYSISKNIFNQNSSKKSHQENILIDQLIQVQPLNRTYHNKDEYQRLNISNRVQQMIYLRENINNLSYREIHFPCEYIILKRLEEKNNLINQNRFKVDQYFQHLKLQYQTISTLYQNIPITSFIYSNQDPSQSDLRFKTSLILSEINENLVKPNNTSTSVSPIDSPILIMPYNQFNHRQYSQNATQLDIDNDHITETKKQNLKFNTAVIVDVRKCPKVNISQTSIQENWKHLKPIRNLPFPENNPQSSIRFFPWSQNFNSTSHIDSALYHPIYNDSPTNISYFPSNKYQFLSTNQRSLTNASVQTTTDISSSIHQTSSTNTDTSSTNTNHDKKTQILNKIKEILNTLQNKLLDKSFLFTKLNHIDQSISNTMTSDSLITTYSKLNKNISQLFSKKSIINVQMEVDSLNNHSYSIRSKRKFPNSAKNTNNNQQTTDDDDDETNEILFSTQSSSKRTISRHATIQYMSPSFMLILQILLVLCLINRILMYNFFSIVPTDTFVSIIVDNSQSSIPISTTTIRETKQIIRSMDTEKLRSLLSLFF